ncbi:MAG: hypothetical protein IKD43_03625 [Clostridia bacterium]|nr:hypothetical protein [Clostridia bacterium]
MDPIIVILIVAAVVFAITSFLYGVFRKFSQMSWVGWQILLVFPLTRFAALLSNEVLTPGAQLWFTIFIMVGSIALVLGLGALLRLAMLKKRMPAHGAWRFADRLMGGITAFVDYAVIALIVGAGVLTFMHYCMTPPELFAPIYESPIWTDILKEHGFDLIVVTVFLFALREGWRVGFARVAVIILMLALTVGAVIVSIYLGIGLGGLSESDSIAQAISITAVILISLLAIIFILAFYAVKFIRNVRYHYFWGTIDGLLGAVLAFAVMFVAACAVNCGVAWIASGTAMSAIENFLASLPFDVPDMSEILIQIQAWGEGIQSLLMSSPIAKALYAGNPMMGGMLIG